MSFSVSTVWEVRPAGSSSNGGGFDVGNANFPTDLAATLATGSSPVVTSASYTFVAGDVGSYVFIRSGTNWTPGFYPITSVSGGAATLNAAIGAVVLYGGATNLNTVAGCATVASPTAGTWGVDYSQQNSGIAVTSITVGATNTQITGASPAPGVNWIGNVLNVATGTGFTVQRVQVANYAAGVATVDKTMGGTSLSGGAGTLGGALDGMVTLSGAMVASNKAFAVGSFTQSATATFAQSSGAAPANPANCIIGYGTHRGDGVRATITLATNTGLTAIKCTGSGWLIENLTIDCASLGTSNGINVANTSTIYNCLVKNHAGTAITASATTLIDSCEITGGLSGSAAMNINQSQAIGCNVHDNAGSGIGVGNLSSVLFNLITNNTGASSNGINGAADCVIAWNTIHGNGHNGISYAVINSNTATGRFVRNNLLTSNGGVGFQGAANIGDSAIPQCDGNVYWNNTSGTRTFLDDIGATNPVNGVAPYINTLDIILTGDPYVSSATGDFRLNSTVGAGAACRGHGVPTSWPGNASTTAFPDQGAAQHQDAGTNTYIFQVEA